MRTFVSKTMLGFGTSGSDVGDQAGDVSRAETGARSVGSGTGAESVEAFREGFARTRYLEPSDQLFENAPVFDLLQANFAVWHTSSMPHEHSMRVVVGQERWTR